ncbi:7TM diverse intracellular signaling domain-containing protein [Roseivirga sp.]|uniref:sensor histidine kinase n=1 Tax=Roseivirga sp. TaxID=1964215 RepID=UPI003B529C91
MKFRLVIYLLIFSSTLAAQEPSYFDLRQESLSEPFELRGKWDFYWNQLIEGDDSTGNFVPMEVPSDWYDAPNPNGYTRTGYASYRIRIKVNTSENLGLSIPHFFSAYKLIVNGHVVHESGKVARTREEYVPYREPQVLRLTPDEDQELDIIVQVANFDHLNAGMHYPITIGSYKSLNYELNLKHSVNLFLAGGLFITGFVLLAFAMAYKHLEKPIPFYALFSISLMYRMLGANPYPIHTIIPDFPYTLSIHLEYMSIHTAALFGGLFVFSLYPKQTHRLLKYIFVGVTAISFLLVILLEPIVFTGLLKYYLFFILAYVGIFIYIIVRARIEKELSSTYLLLAMIVVLIWTLFQIISFLNVGQISYFVNVILVSLIIVFCNLAMFRTFMLKIQSVEQAEAGHELNKTKQTMLSLVSHEIKTPVATLQMNLEMLKATAKDGKYIPPAVMQKLIDGSSTAVDAIKQMVNDFVYFMSRAGSVRTQTGRGEIISRLSERFNIYSENVKLDPDSGLVTYETDLLTLEYIISTLLSNARKYTLDNSRKPEIFIYENGNILTIEVKDHGVGMDEEKVKNLGKTNPELNEKDEVSGVGFYLASELTNQLRHKLVIESRTGVGTSVRILIGTHD